MQAPKGACIVISTEPLLVAVRGAVAADQMTGAGVMAGHPMPPRAAAAHDRSRHIGRRGRSSHRSRRRAGRRGWRRGGSAGCQGDDRRGEGQRPKKQGHGHKSFHLEKVSNTRISTETDYVRVEPLSSGNLGSAGCSVPQRSCGGPPTAAYRPARRNRESCRRAAATRPASAAPDQSWPAP